MHITPHFKQRRSLLKTSATLLTAAHAPAVWAQASKFPTRPIQILMPFPAGDGLDALLRMMSQRMGDKLGQSVVVSNVTGAGGTMAPGNMARTAKPDGYTVCTVSSSSLLRLPYLETRNYDPEKDFTYIVNLYRSDSYAVAVRPDSPWQSVADVVAAAKTGTVNWGGIGVNSSGHIGVLQLSRAAGFSLHYVPYRGGTDLTTSLQGGHVDIMGDAGWITLAEAGKLRLLALMSDNRSPRFPGVPTLRELGYDVVANTRVGIVGPAKMPDAVVKVLHDAFLETSQDAQIQETASLYALSNDYMGTADYTRWALQQTVFERERIKALDLKPL